MYRMNLFSDPEKLSPIVWFTLLLLSPPFLCYQALGPTVSWDTFRDRVFLFMALPAKQMNKQKRKQRNANKHDDSGSLSSLCPLWPRRHPTQFTTLLYHPTPVQAALPLSGVEAAIFLSLGLFHQRLGLFKGWARWWRRLKGWKVDSGLGPGTVEVLTACYQGDY